MTDAPVPPQNLDAEESVLGAMMLNALAIDAVTEVGLAARDFYRGSHMVIYQAILALYAKGEPVDAITVANELDRAGDLEKALGAERIHELAGLVPAAANAAHYARIVREMSTLRGVISAGNALVRLGIDRSGDEHEILEQAERVVFDLTQRSARSELVPASTAVPAAFERLQALAAGTRAVIGVPSGFEALDRLTSGFQPGNLVVLAARPSMGKSALALCMAANIACRDEQRPVALFTLEMSEDEVMQRLIASEALVDSQKIRNGRDLSPEDWSKIVAASSRLQQAPLFIDDSGLITAGEIRSKARKLKMRHPNLALVVVDYLQLMATTGSEENRVQEVSKISRSLKVLARELMVPVLALSQLSRAVEGRHDKRPMLSDLRESGSIEQDADLVAFVYRDEYYNPEEIDQAGIAEVILSKQRNGPTGTVKIGWQKHYARFGDLAR